MTSRNTLIVTVAALVGLGLGATVLRGQVPVSQAQSTQATAPKLDETAARLQNEANTIDIVKRYEPGLVYISTEQTVQADPFGMMFGQGGTQQVEGVGSGFFVNAAGDILTNYHVVRDADRIQIRLLGNKQTYTATVVGRARSTIWRSSGPASCPRTSCGPSRSATATSSRWGRRPSRWARRSGWTSA